MAFTVPSPTGELIADVTVLVTAKSPRDRGEFYARLYHDAWSAEYVQRVLDAYDELVPAPNSPEANLAQPAPWL